MGSVLIVFPRLPLVQVFPRLTPVTGFPGTGGTGYQDPFDNSTHVLKDHPV